MNALPTAADEAKFWHLIEAAWQGADPETAALRARVVRDGDDEAAWVINEQLYPFIERLCTLGDDLSDADLTAFDRVAERKLYDLDREDLHEVTDGSDDGFLYCRGFIVAMGKDYYDAVMADPSHATADTECEEFCYLFAHLYAKRNDGAFPDTGSGISRESVMN